MKNERVEINPKMKPKASVIWLHGLGADGYDFVDIVPQLNLPEHLAVRFVFPHAPVIPVTLNSGAAMRAWFDIYALHHKAPQDEKGVRQSQKVIDDLITQEMQLGISSSRIVLAGFSQGGAMALHCGLRFSQKLAGILVLSGFLMLADTLPAESNPVNQQTPILMIHGTDDPMIPIHYAEIAKDYLKELGHPVAWHAYPMQHTVCPEEIREIAQWLEEVLSVRRE